MSVKQPTPNPAYKLLRDQGMRPAIARHFLTALRQQGFVLVKETDLHNAKKIEQQINIIIKLMQMKGKRT